jgi:hypothetical protein
LAFIVLVFNSGRISEVKRSSELLLAEFGFEQINVGKLSETDILNNDSPTPFIEFKQAGPNLTFDEYCDRHGEWSSIGNDVFIKKTGAFFFSDISLMRVYIFRRGSLEHSFSLDIKILMKKKSLVKSDATKNQFFVHSSKEINETKLEKPGYVSKYHYNIINARLDLTELGLQSTDLNDLKFQVQVRDILTNRTSNSYVDLRVKQMSPVNFDKRKGSMICGKCLYLTKDDDFLTLRWWIEMNRLAGHDKIYLCDHAIEKHQAFTDLFDQYKDFVTLDHLKVGHQDKIYPF